MQKLIPKSSNIRGSNPFLGKVLVGVSAITAVLSAYNYLKSKGAQAEIEYRKSQLSKPVYKLSEEEMINPPWNKDNIRDWLYRKGTQNIMQFKSQADPSIVFNVWFPGNALEEMDSNMLFHLLREKMMKELKEQAWSFPRDSYHINTDISETDLELKMSKSKHLLDLSANWNNFKTIVSLKETLTRMVDNSILTLTSKTLLRQLDSPIENRPQLL